MTGDEIRYTYDANGERTGYEYVEPERQPSGMAKGAHYYRYKDDRMLRYEEEEETTWTKSSARRVTDAKAKEAQAAVWAADAAYEQAQAEVENAKTPMSLSKAVSSAETAARNAQAAADKASECAKQAVQKQRESRFIRKEPDYSNLSSGTIGERAFRTQICDRYNKNIEIEKQYLIDLMKSGAFDGHYNGQGIGMLAEMLMGPSIDEAFATNMVRNFVRELQEKYGWDLGTVAHSGCEAIAVYNVLQDLGKNISLSKIIYDAEFNQYTWLQGWAGVHPENVDDLLSLYGVEFENVDAKDIEKQLQNGNLKSGEIFIAVFYLDKNDTGPTGLIHTVEIEYAPDKNSDEPWIVYNAYNKREMEKTYTSLEDVYGKGAFKYIYEIEGVR